MVGKEEANTEGQQQIHPSFLRTMEQKNGITSKLAGIKHKIGIYSAKGGVGKTTVAVNLAYTLNDMGYRVGLLDADVDTPNVNLFLGINSVGNAEYPLKPIDKDGVKVISTAMFLDDQKKPIIWRGPIVGKMIYEFLGETAWGELDYLIIDLPPGTSDAPLSIMQLLKMDGFILVTTPQRIAAVNAIRSGMMARRMGISVLGVIENMSGDRPRGAEEVAKEMDCRMLGAVRHDGRMSELSDKGLVPVKEDKEIGRTFTEIAKKIAEA